VDIPAVIFSAADDVHFFNPVRSFCKTICLLNENRDQHIKKIYMGEYDMLAFSTKRVIKNQESNNKFFVNDKKSYKATMHVLIKKKGRKVLNKEQRKVRKLKIRSKPCSSFLSRKHKIDQLIT